MKPLIDEERFAFHQNLFTDLLIVDSNGVPSNADKDSTLSCKIASAIVDQLGAVKTGKRLPGQRSGRVFESICCSFLNRTFPLLEHLRPGPWSIRTVSNRSGALEIAKF